MYFKSKKISLLILAITSIVCSRAIFFFFDDSEGPNLLIVAGAAAVIYFLSLIAYLFDSSRKLNDVSAGYDTSGTNVLEQLSMVPIAGIKRLSFAIVIQVAIAGGVCFFLS